MINCESPISLRFLGFSFEEQVVIHNALTIYYERQRDLHREASANAPIPIPDDLFGVRIAVNLIDEVFFDIQGWEKV